MTVDFVTASLTSPRLSVRPQPHSRRIKVKCTVQQQVFNGAILQQQFVTEFVVESNMCGDCNRANTNREAWKASVQLR